MNRWKVRLYKACYPCDKSEIGWQIDKLKEQINQYEQQLTELNAPTI